MVGIMSVNYPSGIELTSEIREGKLSGLAT